MGGGGSGRRGGSMEDGTNSVSESEYMRVANEDIHAVSELRECESDRSMVGCVSSRVTTRSGGKWQRAQT